MASGRVSSYAALDEQDESVRIAVRALGDMRNSGRNVVHNASASTSFQPTPALSVTSRSTSPSLPSPSVDGEDTMARIGNTTTARQESDNISPGSSPDFVKRVSHFPIVNTALRAYEHTKQSSRVVKYGAEMMESSVKTISKPVINRLPVNQLDEFACRQLDRFGSYSGRRPSSAGSQDDDNILRRRSTSRHVAEDNASLYSPPHSREGYSDREPEEYPYEYERGRLPSGSYSEGGWSSSDRDVSMVRGRTLDTSPDRARWNAKGKDRDISMSREDEHTNSRQSTSQFLNHVQESPSRTPTPRQEHRHSPSSNEPQNQQQVVQRSRWQAVLLEAGGIGAAVSEESMRRLKYCLQWLLYATEHIDQQILVLRDFIASLQIHEAGSSSTSPSSSPSSRTYSQDPHHLHTLSTIRKDVVDTIRQVVDVVSKYAGGALPEPAKLRVRSFILTLPQRWASANTGPSADAPSTSTPKPEGKVKTERTGRGNRTAASAPYTYGPPNGEGSNGRVHPPPRSRPASRATSPSSTRVPPPRAGVHETGPAMTHAATKILTLATESLDMLRAVTQVFKESLDKADAWVERLRIVGVQRPQSSQLELPPPSHLNGFSGQSGPLPSLTRELPTPSSNYSSSTSLSQPSPFVSATSDARTSLSHHTHPHSHTHSHQNPYPHPHPTLPTHGHTQTHLHAHGTHTHYRDPLPQIPFSPSASNAPSPAPITSSPPYALNQNIQLPPIESFDSDERSPAQVLASLSGTIGGSAASGASGDVQRFGEMSLGSGAVGSVVGDLKRRKKEGAVGLDETRGKKMEDGEDDRRRKQDTSNGRSSEDEDRKGKMDVDE
ncbi:transcription factor Opi1-domain-containing protein [Abortiporus biennis]|nr:transcription factor Opi1-domain-containing protein [Abortiporus biennis]